MLKLKKELLFKIPWWFACHVKILIVTDDDGSFDTIQGFGLGLALDAIQGHEYNHVRFVFSKAHRASSGEPDVIDNFRFDNHDLAQYSQIWLFGVEALTGALSQAELRALAEFMSGGGGVFATGDHENLGQAMCSQVPRVRSMRRWFHPSGPAGELGAPDVSGADRHDTVMPGAGGNSGSQSDKVPQPIRPRWYTRTTSLGSFARQVTHFPHPLLCGPAGVIDHLPDHMHEGLCEVPADLGQSQTFGGQAFAEYPTVSGHQERPEVVAWATSRNTDGRQFGVIGAYDGHRANVGRVVVDATWHHWFNINLTGLIAASDPANDAYDAAVAPKWEEIKAYFRNVALWLARPSAQGCLRNGGWLIVIRYYDLRIAWKDLKHVIEPASYFFLLGTYARDALGRLASKCQTTRWIIDLLPEIDLRIDPWRQPPLPDPPLWWDSEVLETVALGGAIHALMQKYRSVDPEKVMASGSKEVDAVARKGAALGIQLALREIRTGFDQINKLAKELDRR